MLSIAGAAVVSIGMDDQKMILEIPFVYKASVIPLKARVARNIEFLGRTPVQIDEVPESRAPVVATLTLQSDGGETSLDYREFGGRLFWPVGPWWKGNPEEIVLDGLAGRIFSQRDIDLWIDSYLASARQGGDFTGACPWQPGERNVSSPVSAQDEKGQSGNVREWLDDNRDQAAVTAAGAFREGCILIDGVVWAETSGPCWSMTWAAGNPVIQPVPDQDFIRADKSRGGQFQILLATDWQRRRETWGDHWIYRPGEESQFAEDTERLMRLQRSLETAVPEFRGSIAIHDRDYFKARLNEQTDLITRAAVLASDIEPHLSNIHPIYAARCFKLKLTARSAYCSRDNLENMINEVKRDWYPQQYSPGDRGDMVGAAWEGREEFTEMLARTCTGAQPTSLHGR
jgi:hypothetical protein